MHPSTTQTAGKKPLDPDLAEQAVPGHGIPSQDPDPAAQVLLTPEESERESQSVLMGGSVMAGSAAGVAIGAAVAGPLGMVVGGVIGSVAAGIGAGVAGDSAVPDSLAEETPQDDPAGPHVAEPR